jgi:type I restriction enzyme M protein
MVKLAARDSSSLSMAGTDNRTAKLAIIIQQGKILDFIDGTTQRPETPEEYVRQEIAKSLVREYRYEKSLVEVEFTLRLGSRKPRADLMIFPSGSDHIQENALIVVECKASSVKSADRKEGVGQLQSYMAACPNVSYGMWTNGIERYCYKRVVKDGAVRNRGGPRSAGVWSGRGRAGSSTV